MSAIFSAIESNEISNLILTRKCLEAKDVKENLKVVSKLLEVKNSYAAYRDALPDPKDPNKHCVPYLGEPTPSETLMYL